MKYIDLSYNINSEMPVYPGDMKLTSNKEKDCDKDGFNLYSFSTTMHIGTHIDAPLHMCKNKKSISEYPLDKFVGNAVLLDVRGEKVIRIKDEYYRDIKENDIVLLFSSKSGLYSTKSIDLTKLVPKMDSINILLSVKDKPLCTGVPVPGTYSGSKQSIS